MSSNATDKSDSNHARNVWLASVQPNGIPHLVPVWFVISGEHWYICIEPMSVKARNIAANSHVSLALEDGNNPYILQGRASPHVITSPIAQLFKDKYEWDIASEERYIALYKIIIDRRLMNPNN